MAVMAASFSARVKDYAMEISFKVLVLLILKESLLKYWV